MSRFCEECPLRGEACGELEEAIFSPYSTAIQGILSGKVHILDTTHAGVVIDEDRNASLPIRPGFETADSLTKKIDACDQPDIHEERHLLVIKKEVRNCPALGHLAISDGATYRAVLENPPTVADRGNLRIPFGNTADGNV